MDRTFRSLFYPLSAAIDDHSQAILLSRNNAVEEGLPLFSSVFWRPITKCSWAGLLQWLHSKPQSNKFRKIWWKKFKKFIENLKIFFIKLIKKKPNKSTSTNWTWTNKHLWNSGAINQNIKGTKAEGISLSCHHPALPCPVFVLFCPVKHLPNCPFVHSHDLSYHDLLLEQSSVQRLKSVPLKATQRAQRNDPWTVQTVQINEGSLYKQLLSTAWAKPCLRQLVADLW